jgi:hypothetical protein
MDDGEVNQPSGRAVGVRLPRHEVIPVALVNRHEARSFAAISTPLHPQFRGCGWRPPPPDWRFEERGKFPEYLNEYLN